MRRTTRLACAAALAWAGCAVAQASKSPPVVNPLLPSGADPFVTTAGGRYYFMSTRGDRLEIRTTRHLGALAAGPVKVIWRAPASGPASKSIWAPELHEIGDRWYVYFTGSVRGHDDDDHRRVYVLESDGPDPLAAHWTQRGALPTDHPGIDPTVFTLHGRLYFMYSAYVGDESRLMIAPMRDPVSFSGPEVEIARPTRTWEMFGGRKILEGPEFLEGPTGRLFISYSASACWADEYALGLLSAPAGADPLDVKTWTKSQAVVFGAAKAARVYAPGHNAFFKSPDGREDWIVYHANDGPNYRCDKRRSPRAQRFGWTKDGAPDLGLPLRAGAPEAAPSGETDR